MKYLFLIFTLLGLKIEAQVSKKIFLGTIIQSSKTISKDKFMNTNDVIINIEKSFNNNYTIGKNGELTYFTDVNYVGKDTMVIETNNLLHPKIKLIFCSIYQNTKKNDSIIVKSKSTKAITLYPNPTVSKSNIVINYSNFEEENLNIKLFSLNGSLIKTWEKLTAIDNNSISLDLPDVVNGIYFIIVYDSNDNFITSEQIIITKS